MKQAKTFDVYITPEDVHIDNKEICPHCKSDKVPAPEMIDYYGSIYHPGQADIMKCPDCKKLNVVVQAPYINSSESILTTWTVPEQQPASKGGLTQ